MDRVRLQLACDLCDSLLAAGAASLERLYPHGLPHKLPKFPRVPKVGGKGSKLRLFQGEWGEGTSEGTSEGTF